MTLLLYLNEGFSGGQTCFVPEQCSTNLFKQGFGSGMVAITPKPGLVLLFDHDIYHAGAALTAGRKYVLRMDVMFSAHEGHEYRLEGIALDREARCPWLVQGHAEQQEGQCGENKQARGDRQKKSKSKKEKKNARGALPLITHKATTTTKKKDKAQS